MSFTTTYTVNLAPIDAFNAINNVRGWWSERVTGTTDEVGGVFDYDVPGIHRTKAEVTQLIPGALVEWKVLENWMVFVDDQSEWIGTTIRFELRPVPNGTEVHFVHVGLEEDFECYENCSAGWSAYAGNSLHRLLNTGTGAPITPADEEKIQQDFGVTVA